MSLFANKFSICQALVCVPTSLFFACYDMHVWVYVCVCVYLASRQKRLRLSSCRVPREPGSFPAQHITLQNYRERSCWKMRLILDRNCCSNPQAPPPAFFFSLCLFLCIYCISHSIFYFLHLLFSFSPFFLHSYDVNSLEHQTLSFLMWRLYFPAFRPSFYWRRPRSIHLLCLVFIFPF